MTKTKRLLALVQLPPPIHGVSRANQVLLQSGVLRQYFDVRVINLSVGGTKARRGQLGLNRITYGLKVIVQMVLMLPRTDLVYFTPALQGAALWRDTIIGRLIRLFGVPYILHPHSGGIGTNDGGKSFSRPLNQAVKELFAGAEKVVLLHESIRSGYDGFISDGQKTVVVGNGVPGLPPHPAPATGEPLRLGFLGNLISYKGFHHAVDVMAELPGAVLDVVGDFSSTSYEQQIRDQIDKLGIADRIIFHGRKDPDDAWEPLARIHFLLFTSDWREGLPLVWLESMMRGVPVASFRIGAWSLLEEVAPQPLATIGRSSELATQIEVTFTDQDHYVALRSKVAQHAHANFSSAQWAQRIAEALRS